MDRIPIFRELLVFMMLILLLYVCHADIPQIINYQGKITDGSGIPVSDGSYDMRFNIFDVETGGTSLWYSGTVSVDVTDGIFSVVLGETPQPSVDLPFDEDYWLSVWIGGDPQSPRQKLGSVGYAYIANSLVPGAEVIGAVTTGTSSVITGTNTATTGISHGICGYSASSSGSGVYGYASATSGNATGGSFETESPTGRGVYGTASATSGDNSGIYGHSASTAGSGVYGSNSAGSGYTAGVYGRCYSDEGTGVEGWAWATSGTTYGGNFTSTSTEGRGVYGRVTASSGVNYGGQFECASPNSKAVIGYASATTGSAYGAEFETESPTGRGVYGTASATTGNNYGVYGHSASETGRGVFGSNSAGSGYTAGVYGRSYSDTGTGVEGWAWATSGITCGGNFSSTSTEGRGVYGRTTATTGINYGVYGETSSPSGYAGYFQGDVDIAGSISKGSGSFLIDHPLDPENKLLRHNFVESPENLLIYRGKTRLDETGESRVDMPDYFVALTREDDASIHLTPVSTPTLVAAEWSDGFNSFIVRGTPDLEVFWEVLADRDDPVIHQLGRPVEEAKGPDNKHCGTGELIYPEAYGYPESRGRNYELHSRKPWNEDTITGKQEADR